MKKIFLCLAVCTLAFNSCKKDDDDAVIEEPAVDMQNSYDNEAALKYLTEHYLDAKGNIKAFSSTDATDDNYTKLSAMNPITLPSGVIYIVRPDAQPVSGTAIGDTDMIKLMSNTMTYVATKTDDVVAFTSGSSFKNTISGSGVPDNDPAYYYVKKSVLEKGTTDATKQRSYYEIEGFKEALKKFTAFNLSDDSDYNLQGVIIVPSRAAFARDAHFNFTGLSYRNRSFVFNFQVYKSTVRPINMD